MFRVKAMPRWPVVLLIALAVAAPQAYGAEDDWVTVPGGRFVMGDPQGEPADAPP